MRLTTAQLRQVEYVLGSLALAGYFFYKFHVFPYARLFFMLPLLTLAVLYIFLGPRLMDRGVADSTVLDAVAVESPLRGKRLLRLLFYFLAAALVGIWSKTMHLPGSNVWMLVSGTGLLILMIYLFFNKKNYSNEIWEGIQFRVVPVLTLLFIGIMFGLR